MDASPVKRQVAIRGEVQHIRNNVGAANEAKEALAKAVSHKWSQSRHRGGSRQGGTSLVESVTALRRLWPRR